MAPRRDDDVHSDAEEAEDVEQEVRRPKRKKHQCGAESGLTEEERRVIRRKQREVSKKLLDGPVEDEEDFVEKARKDNNALFQKVSYTREAVLDAENVNAIAAKYAKQVDQMVQVPRYDPVRLINKLKSKCTNRSAAGHSFFDWKTLGQEAGICFNSVPSRVSFLVGPLESGRQPMKKKQAVRQKKAEAEETCEEVKPEEVGQHKQKKDVDKLSAAERTLGKIQKTLIKRSKQEQEANSAKCEEMDPDDPMREQLENHGHEVDLTQLLFNPKSFTQTVENLFHYSFLVKHGEAAIKFRSNMNGGQKPGIYGYPPPTQSEHPTPKQCIVSLSMSDWRRMVKAYDVEKCDVPHRSGTKQTKAPTSREPLSQMSQNSAPTESP